MRQRLKKILESAQYTVNIGGSEVEGEDGGDQELDLDEEIISLDYLDEVDMHVYVQSSPQYFLR